jgi:phage baseplate assembly protein W
MIEVTHSGNIKYGTTGVNEIVQNVSTIIKTRRGTVPLDRRFGLSQEYLDKPFAKARAELEQDIFLTIMRYEPRAEVARITYRGDGIAGLMQPTVHIRIKRLT